MTAYAPPCPAATSAAPVRTPRPLKSYPPAACRCEWVELPTYLPDHDVDVGIININGQSYTVELVNYTDDDGAGARRFVFTKHTDDAEPVYVDRDPASGDYACTCPDATYRRGAGLCGYDGARLCKHVQAARWTMGETASRPAPAAEVPADEPCPF